MISVLILAAFDTCSNTGKSQRKLEVSKILIELYVMEEKRQIQRKIFLLERDRTRTSINFYISKSKHMDVQNLGAS
jgi:hypothetical protein